MVNTMSCMAVDQSERDRCVPGVAITYNEVFQDLVEATSVPRKDKDSGEFLKWWPHSQWQMEPAWDSADDWNHPIPILIVESLDIFDRVAEMVLSDYSPAAQQSEADD